MIRIGCSGWNYVSWRESFYPKGLPAARWLEHYASVFDTVELNTTFYRLVQPTSIERWVQQTPSGFCFAVKSSRYLTHIKRLTAMERGVQRLVEPLEPLRGGSRMGPMLRQLPANFHRDDERLVFALDNLPAGRHTFEFRHASWFCPAVYEAPAPAQRRADDRRPARDRELSVPRDHRRLHLRALSPRYRGRRGNYSKSELAEWAPRIAEWATTVDVYAYFNNDGEEFAPRNALTLARQLGLR